MYNSVFFCILAFLLLSFVIGLVLSWLNYRDFGKPLPESLQGIYDNERYDKQQRYSTANYKLSLISTCFSTLVTVIALSIGLYGWIDAQWRTLTDNAIWLCLLFFGVIELWGLVSGLPFSYYKTFVIEENFGFNKQTRKLFWADEFKSLLLEVVLGGGILALITYLYLLTTEWFWLLAWGVLSVFMLFMTTFYSNLIVPLFNKQTPLEEGPLRNAIESFAGKVGFKLDNIYVIDGSKRSTKANAYFSGLGPKKRIVLYDTLIEKMSVEEIVAVLAHEIGHYKHKHTLKSVVSAFVQNLLMFGLLGYFLSWPALTEAMNGGSEPVFHLALYAFTMLYSPISICLGLWSKVSSRKHEYQADAFAAKHGLGDALISALKKLSADSLTNLQPHPAYVFVHYSHPTLLQRMTAIMQVKCE
ncbi:MAG: M48 family metallopeptidase [Paludibacteraceae bacterium]|nr:M48 family metallopeptidase [Paludibacteraceae bacterium]